MGDLCRRGWCPVVIAVALAFVAATAASAEPVLSFSGAVHITAADVEADNGITEGWSFTPNQAVTVTALDVAALTFEFTTATSTQVRLYDSTGTTLASAQITASDPTEGSSAAVDAGGDQALFRTQAITPVALSAGTTYYIAQDNPGLDYFGFATGIITDPAITYGGPVIYRDTFGNPTDPMIDTLDGFFGKGFFGPNFDIASAVPLPPAAWPGLLCMATLALAVTARARSRRASSLPHPTA